MDSLRQTADWIVACRANKVDISKDIYAKLFLNYIDKDDYEQYLREVSSNEDFLLSLRNRYFLEKLKNILEDDMIVFNFGCGYSMYPYLINSKATFIEIDQKNVIKLKKRIVSENNLPLRNVKFVVLDLNNTSELKRLLEEVRGKRVICIFEGISYYLPKSTLKEIADSIEEGHLLINYWKPELKEKRIFERLSKYCDHIYDLSSSTFYNNFHFKDFLLEEDISYKELADKLHLPFPKEEVIMEHFSHLKSSN